MSILQSHTVEAYPVEYVSPPCEDMSPPCEDVSPPCEDVSPPCEDVSPPCGGVSLLCGDVSTPCKDVYTPCEDVSTHCGGVSLLCGDVSTPCEDTFEQCGYKSGSGLFIGGKEVQVYGYTPVLQTEVISAPPVLQEDTPTPSYTSEDIQSLLMYENMSISLRFQLEALQSVMSPSSGDCDSEANGVHKAPD